MNKGLYIFLIVFGGFFFCQETYAQQTRQNNNSPVSSLYLLSFPHKMPAYFTVSGKSHPVLSINTSANIITNHHPALSVAKNMSVCNMAFFCRQEWKVEKMVKIPIRLRMGSLAQCNALEGK